MCPPAAYLAAGWEPRCCLARPTARQRDDGDDSDDSEQASDNCESEDQVNCTMYLQGHNIAHTAYTSEIHVAIAGISALLGLMKRGAREHPR